MSASTPPSLQALAAELQEQIRGDVRFDETSRLLYATDASIYQMLPHGVVIPREEADVIATMRLAAKHGVPILPRGSGTSLAGQTVNAAVVLDFTPYMAGVLEVNPRERWVRVQPGVILDELNALLKPHGLRFAPDVATSNRASVGGMMGNNSSGAHSILYGKTVDHVLEQRVVLSDGTVTTFREMPLQTWLNYEKGDTLEARIYREVGRVCREHAAEIDRRFPRIMRRVGGYNLDEIVRYGRLNLAKIMVGSEGTLATVVEAKLNLVPLPRYTGLIVSHFNDLIEALETTPLLLSHKPSAVELTDRIILNLTRGNSTLARARSFLQGEPEAILVTEFYSDSEEELRARLEELQSVLVRERIGYAHPMVTDAAGQRDVWNIRKAGLGLLMGMKGDPKPVGFVEDTAVPPEHLAAYIREFRALLRRHGAEACYYAHASVGCLHVRPILNLKEATDRQRMREIAEGVAELVLKYGGAVSAEHGDGLARSEFQQRMFGPVLYQAFREVKAAFDPHGLMNPGKIVDAPPMDANLRIGGGYQTIPVSTILDFSRDGGFARAVELCSGVGACRKNLDGTMCPSYRATRDEAHSTRGRANVLRMVLSGQAKPVDGGRSELADPRVHEVLDLCLECKACKSECPSNVDMAKMKYEFLSTYHEKHGTPLRARFFGGVAGLNRLAALAPRVANKVQEWPATRTLMERVLGIDARRPLPRYADATFLRWFRSRRPASDGSAGDVLLIADTFTNYQEPDIGKAAVRLLEAFGYRVVVPHLRCCGRPQISKGLLREARASAEYNVEQLLPWVRNGTPILGLEPSCTVTFRDEYADFGLGEPAREVAANTWLVQDFLAERHGAEARLPFSALSREVRLHGHCHQKAVFGTARTVQALKMASGFRVTEIPSGCCGMAGSFGYEREHYDLSLQIGEQSLFGHVRSAPEGALIVAPGTSCRHQLADVLGVRALHPVQALELALSEGEV